MTQIIEIHDADEKSRICDDILRALHSWFEVEASIVSYVAEVRELPFYAAVQDSKAIGFVAVKQHGEHTAEIYVMGVLQEAHRQGIGSRLIAAAVEHCRANAIEFLTVKTLDESQPDEGYANTRKFYYAQGFRKLEVFTTLWDEQNPCLFMCKHL